MTTEELISTAREAPAWSVALAAAFAVGALVGLAVLLRRWGRRNLATKVTGLATVLGLGWSAQGMFHTATTTYDQPWQIAAMLFIVFEAWLVGRMLWAHRYRTDRPRRSRFVGAVWVGAVVMAVVVAAGEGWAQAPGRLAIPLLVTYGWYTDLTADDDPAERLDTERRWTWREVGLRVGWLKVRDADVADRSAAEARYLVQRMARLEFAIEFGTGWVSVLLRRQVRLAKLRLQAEPGMLAEVAERIARAKGEEPPQPETHPTMPPQPVEPVRVPTPEPTPAVEPRTEPERPAGHPTGTTVRTVDGVTLWGTMSGGPLAEHFGSRLLSTKGATTDSVRMTYTPEIGKRMAQEWAAQARKRAKVNGHVPDLTLTP